MTLERAIQMQFRLVDIIHRNFNGNEVLQAGDYGVVKGIGRPSFTTKVESVLAEFFEAKGALLVRGAGTGAIRSIFIAALKPGDQIIVHRAPIYPTTEVTIRSMGLNPVLVDMNDLNEFKKLINDKIKAILIQCTRQRMEDSYEVAEVINVIKETNRNPIIIADDNYAAMRVEKIGSQLGADISTFSLFKLLGPEGIGCVIGGSERSIQVIEKIREDNYSGGCQVQGPEAMDALRSLVYTPVALAIQARVIDETTERLNAGEVEGVKKAYIANAQSRVILVELDEPIAEKVLELTWKYGAAPQPVGAESRYEISAMFYRVSHTFRQDNPELSKYVIRINPMRSGPDTIIRILKEAIREVKSS